MACHRDQLEGWLPDSIASVVDEFKLVDGGFTAVIRAEIGNKAEAQKWLEEFKHNSLSSFVVRSTYPNSEKFSFACDYVCHHSSWKKAATKGESLRKKGLDCKAKLSIRVCLHYAVLVCLIRLLTITLATNFR